MHSIWWVGLDVHKKFIQVAMFQDQSVEPDEEWTVAKPDRRAVKRLARKMIRIADGGEIRCCYEAGPAGFSVKRWLEDEAPLVCEVIAPALIPIKPGERIKTDRRDAQKLARLSRAGELTVVAAPTEEEEAVRALCRQRDQVREDLMRARHRLSKFLLQKGLAYRTPGSGRATHWTKAHRAWLRGLAFSDPVEQLLLENYIEMVDRRKEALKSVDDALDVVATTEPYVLPVRWLKALRGVDTLTAMILVAELFDIRRFESASELMAYLGLVPSERSSGGHRRAGGITRAGNGFVRRILIESAWHYQHKSRPASAVHKRREGLPPEVVEVAERAESRLHRRYWRLTQRGKAPTVAATAVARELVGFAWALMKMASETATQERQQPEEAVAA